VTGTLPQEVRDVFERFITTEYTTVGTGQQPITWPVTPYYTADAPCIDLTTGLGYPKKADDARRHPSVALLFSDPTGSGIDSGIQVLVHGTAEVDEEDLEANADRYFRESSVKLPATRKMHPPKPIRRFLDWYYTRIYVHVRPERVFVWPEGDLSREPVIHGAHVEEVRSGHSEEPAEDHAPLGSGAPAWDSRVDELGRENTTAVLSWLAPDGFPIAVRTPIRVDAGARSIAIEGDPAGLPLLEGRACLAAHRHAPDFSWQRNFQVRGDLAREGERWRLVPRRLVGGFELPEGAIRRNRDIFRNFRRFRRTAKRRLKADKSRH